MDTGCGHDLVREALVEGYPTTGHYNGERQKKIVLATANGKVSSRHAMQDLKHDGCTVRLAGDSVRVVDWSSMHGTRISLSSRTTTSSGDPMW